MNKYIEYKKRKQAEFDKLPMKAAFGNKQFEQIMKEWGLTTSKEDLTKIHQLGAGCYCLKKDYPLFLKLACKHMEEDVEFLRTIKTLRKLFVTSSVITNVCSRSIRMMLSKPFLLQRKR